MNRPIDKMKHLKFTSYGNQIEIRCDAFRLDSTTDGRHYLVASYDYLNGYAYTDTFDNITSLLVLSSR